MFVNCNNGIWAFNIFIIHSRLLVVRLCLVTWMMDFNKCPIKRSICDYLQVQLIILKLLFLKFKFNILDHKIGILGLGLDKF